MIPGLMSEQHFNNRVIAITGASGNLGRAVSDLLGEQGARLVLIDRADASMPDAGPHRVHLPGLDLTRPDAAAAAVSAALQAFGRIDGVVHTVGGFAGGRPVWEADPTEWDRMFAVNVRTALNIIRAAVPPMIAQGSGRIVVVGAKAGVQGIAGHAAYSASKASLLRLIETLGVELKSTGVTANAVLPGTMDTLQNRTAMPKADHAKWVKTESVARTIAFLLSDAASDVSGGAIPVYGSR